MRWLRTSAVSIMAGSVALGVAGCASDPDPGATPDETDPAGVESPETWLAEPGRLGPLIIGAAAESLASSDLVRPFEGEASCGWLWEAGPALPEDVWVEFRDGDPDDLDQIRIPGAHRTPEGAGVGTSLADLRDIYGDRLVYHSWLEEGGAADGYTIYAPEGALTFDFGSTGDSTGTIAHDQPDDEVVVLTITRGADEGSFEAPTSGC